MRSRTTCVLRYHRTPVFFFFFFFFFSSSSSSAASSSSSFFLSPLKSGLLASIRTLLPTQVFPGSCGRLDLPESQPRLMWKR